MEWKNNIKVAQLGAFVAQKTDYKHGEQNLFDTIIKMAQLLLEPITYLFRRRWPIWH